MKVPLAGGTPTTLFAGPSYPGYGQVVVDATSVYWVDPNVDIIAKVPIAGGAATTLAWEEGYSGYGTAIALDATSLYWSAASPGTLLKVPKDGGPYTPPHRRSGGLRRASPLRGGNVLLGRPGADRTRLEEYGSHHDGPRPAAECPSRSPRFNMGRRRSSLTTRMPTG